MARATWDQLHKMNIRYRKSVDTLKDDLRRVYTALNLLKHSFVFQDDVYLKWHCSRCPGESVNLESFKHSDDCIVTKAEKIVEA